MIFKTNKKDNSIFIDLQSEELYPKYYDLFGEYNYEGNGYCWEGHIIQILEKIKPEILSHVEFDPEAGSITILSSDLNPVEEISSLLNPIFTDLDKLKEYIKVADPDMIDD